MVKGFKALLVAGAAVAALGLAGCATSVAPAPVDTIATGPSPDENLGGAIALAEAQARAYLNAGRNVRRNRNWLNYGIVAARTFVTGAAGLEAHPDSIFIGALAGTTFHQLDPVINPGDTRAWHAAYRMAVCVRGGARSANTSTMVDDVALLRAFPNVDGVAATIADYTNTFPADVVSALGIVEINYVRGTTGPLLSVSDLQTRITAHEGRIGNAEEEQESEANEEAAERATEETNADRTVGQMPAASPARAAFYSAAMARARTAIQQERAADVSAASARIRATLAAARETIDQCVAEPAEEPDEEPAPDSVG